MGNVTALNTSKYNWGEELKVDINDAKTVAAAEAGSAGTPRGPIAPGTYSAFLQEVKHGTFKTGSYGMTFTFVIEGGENKNRKIREYLVLTKADGTAVQYANTRLKRRLLDFGLPLEKINAFKGPRNEHDLGDFRLTLGAPVTVIVADAGMYNGVPSRKVKAVYKRAIAE